MLVAQRLVEEGGEVDALHLDRACGVDRAELLLELGLGEPEQTRLLRHHHLVVTERLVRRAVHLDVDAVALQVRPQGAP